MAKDLFLKVDFSEKYNINSVFSGSIVSTHSKVNHLVYCIDSMNYKKLTAIDEHEENYKELPKRPKLGSYFVYFSRSRKSFFRAYNMGTNPVEPTLLKTYFLDTGEIHYLKFEKEKFFYLPSRLQFPAMGMLCKINTCPKQFKSIIEFIEKFMMKKIKFKIVNKLQIENKLGIKEMCLLVDVNDIPLSSNNHDMHEKLVEVLRDDNNQICKLTRSALMKFESSQSAKLKFSYACKPVMFKQIPPRVSDFQPNDKVIIYKGIMIRSNVFYGICRNISEAHMDMKALTMLMIKMNEFNVEYEQLGRWPFLNEMVVVCEQAEGSERYYRGAVLKIIDEICMILYIDYGYIRPYHYKKIYKFPIEFLKTPYHCSRIHASNIDFTFDKVQNHESMLLIEKSIHFYCFGKVENINGIDITVKLYDKKGYNLNEVLMRFNKPLRLPKKTTHVKHNYV